MRKKFASHEDPILQNLSLGQEGVDSHSPMMNGLFIFGKDLCQYFSENIQFFS